MSKIQLSKIETNIIEQAFQTAYQRETSALIAHVRDRSASINQLNDLWNLHDLLSTKRHEIEGKYVFDETSFVFDLASLIKTGWLELTDLQGLNSGTLSKISAIARM